MTWNAVYSGTFTLTSYQRFLGNNWYNRYESSAFIYVSAIIIWCRWCRDYAESVIWIVRCGIFWEKKRYQNHREMHFLYLNVVRFNFCATNMLHKFKHTNEAVANLPYALNYCTHVGIRCIVRDGYGHGVHSPSLHIWRTHIFTQIWTILGNWVTPIDIG